jgi:ABC-type polysaccharide/polyol phosphate transport system ATPase subunit
MARSSKGAFSRARWQPTVAAGAAPETDNNFWALRGVWLDVKQGEVVGIIGRNGAGKSTLLKILSRITEPTEGRVCIRGRIASLLEVGTGFHPELTGRENIFLNGAILGMTRGEIKKRFDEIVDFAGVEKFLDTPVKRFSSGMYVRLAFAVAAHLEPEILIVDEVLAVGDVEFQKKCLGKMRTVSTSGRTVLFVSHNMVAIQSLCSRAVYLREGHVEAIGPAAAMVRRHLFDSANATTRRLNQKIAIGGLKLVRFEVMPNPVESGTVLRFMIGLGASCPVRLSDVSILIHTEADLRVGILDLRGCGLPLNLQAAQGWAVEARITSLPLVEGDYRLGLYLRAGDFGGNLPDLITLTVEPCRRQGEVPSYAAAHRGVLELDFETKTLVYAVDEQPTHIVCEGSMFNSACWSP